ncbi:hypothetical protein Tco_0495812 [Tanacetum coccineum]
MNIPPIDPPSTVIGTLAIAPPLEDIAANLETMSTPASVDTPRATEPAIKTTKGDPEQQQNISAKNEVSVGTGYSLKDKI